MCELLHDVFVGLGIMFIILVAFVYASIQMRKEKEK
jgi:hypothetical protein